MKLSLLLLAGFCTLALAHQRTKITDKDFLRNEQRILRLFRYVNQASHYPEHVNSTYKFHEHFDFYTHEKSAKDFYNLYQVGLLPRDEIFSVFHEKHQHQAAALFKLFYYAKDFETLHETAVWARNNLNQGLFLYSFSVAIVHRPDTYKFILPPIYEVYPYYFFGSDVISKVQRYKQQYYLQKDEVYTFEANYSGQYLNLNPEQALSYFTEDVGINAFYYYYAIYYPFWLSNDVFNFHGDHRGEQFYFLHQQILARYYLERLSNGYGEIGHLTWEVPLETGYYPSLRYPNGLEFPTRPNFASLHEYFTNYGQRWSFKGPYGYSYTLVQDFERRIRDAIDQGYVFDVNGKKIDLYAAEGFNKLGNMVEGNPDSANGRFYGMVQVYARHLLGYSMQALDAYKLAPSALEHFETSLRDPAFYQLFKRLVLIFQTYKIKDRYHSKELYFEGVKVKGVKFDRLITYFDHFHSDLSNAYFVSREEFDADSLQVRARQYRLNHKPFTYRIEVEASDDQAASVFVYLGPKFDEYNRAINLSENRHNFVLFDHFKHELKAGSNTIERNSQTNDIYADDRTSFRDLYRQVGGAIEGSGEFYYEKSRIAGGFPRRFMLPKGSYEGQEYQFYVFVNKFYPYQYHDKSGDENVAHGFRRVDGYPLGYPFDRPIYYENFFRKFENSFVYTAKIYHRHEEDVNASNVHE